MVVNHASNYGLIVYDYPEMAVHSFGPETWDLLLKKIVKYGFSFVIVEGHDFSIFGHQ